MNAAHQRSLTPVLAVTAVVLGALLLLLLGGVGSKVHWGVQRSLTPLPPASSAASLPPPLPLEQFAVVWQKPLFSPDRKPVPLMANPGAGLGDLELSGIILTPTLRMALLRDKSDDHREVRLHEGQSLPDGSVTLFQVLPRSALFDTSAGRTELKLPAGAPFDGQKTDAAATTPADQSAPAGAMIITVPGSAGRQETHSGNNPGPRPRNPQQNQSNQPFLDQLRQNIQKRRAANAAAANEGVR